MKNTFKQAMCSVLALVMTLSALLGTTFAWFTDSATSSGNVIASGNLDAKMHWSDKLLAADSDEWQNADGTPVFNYNNWEPGYTEVRYVKVSNAGSLNFKWKLSIEAEGKVTDLSDVIDVYYVNPVTAEITKDSLATLTSAGTLTDVLDNNTGVDGRKLTPGSSAILAIAFHMDENAGNDYQNKSLCEAGFALKLLATQDIGEYDSFDDQYDIDAEWPYSSIKYSVSQSIADVIDTETGALTEDVTVGEITDDQYAEIPADVKLADGAESLTLKVESIETPNKDIPVTEGETARSVDIHIDGLAEDNTVPVTVTLKALFSKGLNTTSVKMYHIEGDTPVEMTLVSTPVNHNEFSYDPATGDVVMTVATFSEYVPVTDNYNLWKGDFDISWYNTTDTEFTILTADQLAGFGAIVDGGGEYTNKNGTKDNVPSDMFEGKTVKLGADIDLAGGYSLNPIGCGYVNGTNNSGGLGVNGRSFMGTFDGQNHTIRYLYQNGWDLGLEYCNLGGGLFASVCNATIKNLNMLDAEIVMECVEQGVIAGLAQGNCTFENITISNCSVANYQRATGGVVGEVSQGIGDAAEFTHTFKNIRIDNKTVVGSLWGDFDAPVGGVIGGYWDDSNRTKVVMENVEVACRLDVYNDVTSSYQWYAYRRAGMLIGNTDQAEGRTATAKFLTCKLDENGNKTVKVYYGNWTKYHYCEFNNHNPSWPWVRVEAGEHCTAYSNPRYGVPNDPETGKPVTGIEHNHSGDDEHNVELEFNQLYGGGQGVYGQPEHDDVEVVKYVYTITYINDYKVLDVRYITEEDIANVVTTENNDAAKLVKEWADVKLGQNNYVFSGWMNAGSTKIETIPNDNDNDITLYPYFNNPYTARFVDQQGNVLSWCLFHKDDMSEITSAQTTAEAHLPDLGEGFTFAKWVIQYRDINNKLVQDEYNEKDLSNFKNYTTDVTLYPHYDYNGDVKLNPVDSNGDGIINYYEVAGYGAKTGEQELVEIPNEVNGAPVTTINADAFSSYDDLYAVRIPANITAINYQSFSANNATIGTKRDMITLYYEGDPDVWKAAMIDYNNRIFTEDSLLKSGWDNMMGDGSRVFFLDANGKVDMTKGYWELCNKKYETYNILGIKGERWASSDYVWVYHNHAYIETSDGYYESSSNRTCLDENGNPLFHYKDYTDYLNEEVTIDGVKGYRPDQKYWTPVATTKED